jgi:signal peptidase I
MTTKDQEVSTVPKTHAPWMGVLLSFIMAGAGQFVSGERALGIKWFIGVTVSSYLFLWVAASSWVPGLLPVLIFGAVVLGAWLIMLRNSFRSMPRLTLSKWLILILVVLAISAAMGAANRHVMLAFFQAFKMSANSMAPTLEGPSKQPGILGVDGDRVIVQKYAYWLSKPKRGDIVAFNRKTFSAGSPDNVVWCKRILGTPGDKVELIDRTLYVNDQPIREDYVQYIDPGSLFQHYGPYVVPPMQYFVMGDNRDNSQDSRSDGAIPATTIIGKATKIYWPLRRAGAVR